MKILLTGGGTGGHFYPLIAVAQEIKEESKKLKLIEPKIYFASPDPYNKKILFDNQISFVKVSSGKKRTYRSILNFFDSIKTFFGILVAIWKVFWIYPEVIFSKGGYGSFPVVFAGRILGIPIFIHESDSYPGRVNLWSGKFAKRIAISYPEAANFFPKEKVAWTGNPIRKDIMFASKSGAFEYLNLRPGIPVLFVIGGSQGSEKINSIILDSLEILIENFQIIHQTGPDNWDEVSKISNAILQNSEYKERYKPFKYLNDLAMKMTAGVSNLVITRAGSALFEIANWGIPSIIIPITESNGNHQQKNAYTYARTGAGIVIEENNLLDDILIAQINNIFDSNEKRREMIKAAKSFAKPEAANIIAKEILKLALGHEYKK